MRLKISFQGPGGELDSRTVDTEQQAAAAAVEMIQSAGELQAGDVIVISEIEG